MRIVRCADPLHATRAGQPGFSDELARRPNIPDGPDVIVDGLFCGACGKVFHDNKIVQTEAERTARRAAVQKFLNDNPTWTRAQLRRFFGAALGVDPGDDV